MHRRSAVVMGLMWILGVVTVAGAGGPGQIAVEWSRDAVHMQPVGPDRTTIRMEGGVSLPELGVPDLPWKVVTVPASATSRVVSWKWIPGPSELLADSVLPTPTLYYRPASQGGAVFSDPDAAVFSGVASYPPEAVRFQGMQARRGVPFAIFHICPFSWDPVTRELSWSPSGTLEVSFASDGDPNRFLPVSPREAGKAAAGGFGGGIGGEQAPLGPTVLYDLNQTVAPNSRPSLDSPPVEFLLVTDTTLVESFRSLIAWKNQMGSPATWRTVQWIERNYSQGVDLPEKIRLFLKDAHNLWGVQTVVLAGDPSLVPIRYGRSYYYCPPNCDIASDLYYACLDGNWNGNGNAYYGETPRGFSGISGYAPGDDADLIPDIKVGRISARRADQAAIFLNKYMKYVKDPVRSPTYLDSMLVLGEVLFEAGWNRGACDSCGSCQVGVPAHPCPSLDGAIFCRSMMAHVQTTPAGHEFGFDQLYERTEHWNNKWDIHSHLLNLANLEASLTQGRNVVFHTGHGDRDRWAIGPDRLLVSNMLGLNCNQRFAGMAYAVNCNSAAVDADCMGEAWQFSPNGGGLDYVGSTSADYPDAAKLLQEIFFRRWLRDDATTPGQAFTEVADSIGTRLGQSESPQRFLLFSVIFLGDPDMPVWKTVPGELALDPLPDVYLGGETSAATTVPIRVTFRGAGPAQGARVCLYKAGDAMAVGTTGANGTVSLPFRPTGSGPFTVTVTHPRAIPLIDGTHEVLKKDTKSFVAVVDYAINDGNRSGTAGNENGQIELGETISLKLNLTNQGTKATTGLQLRLRKGQIQTPIPLSVTLLDSLLSVTQPLGAGQSREISTAFRINVSPANNLPIADGARRMSLPLNLIIQDGAGTSDSHVQELSPSVSRPDLLLVGTRLRDRGSVTSNGLPDDGESIALVTELYNRGGGTASHLRGRIRPVSAGSVAIEDSSIVFGDIHEESSVVSDTCRFHVVRSASLQLTLVVEDTLTTPPRKLLQKTMSITRRPAVPESLRTFGNQADIKVTWMQPPVPDTTIAGYRIYRTAGLDTTFTTGNFQLLGSGFIPQEQTYTDDGLAPLARFFYRVVAVSRSGMESQPSWAVEGNSAPGVLPGWPNYVTEARDAAPGFDHIKLGIGGAYSLVFSSDLLYAFRADGTELVDGDGLASTRGPLINGTSAKIFQGKPAICNVDGVKLIIAAALQAGDNTSSGGRLLAVGGDGVQKWVTSFPNRMFVLSAPAIGDIDGDGEPEIVLLFNRWVMAFEASNGTPFRGLTDGKLFAIPGGEAPINQISYQYQSVALADVDNDGRDEIIFTSSAGSDGRYSRLYVINGLQGADSVGTNAPGFPFRFSRILPGNESSSASVAVGDVTSWQAGGTAGSPDGKPDIIAHTRTQLWVFDPSKADSTKVLVWHRDIEPRASNESEQDPLTSSPALGDINDNGSLDIVVGGNKGRLYAFDGRGNALPGLSTGAQPYKQVGSSSSRMGSPILADLSGDQIPDIVIGDNLGKIYALRSTGASLRGFPYTIDGAKIGMGLAAWDVDNDVNHTQNLVIQSDKVQNLIVLEFPDCRFDSTACPWPVFRHDARNTGFINHYIVTPIERVMLEGEATASRTVELRWSTQSNYTTFMLDRMLVPDGEWERAGEFSAAEIQVSPGSYRLVDQPPQGGVWQYRLMVVDITGHEQTLGETTVNLTGFPAVFHLYPARPNPFQPSTAIRLDLPRPGRCRVSVLDASGREIRRVHQGPAGPGTVTFFWDGLDEASHAVGSGVYFIRVEAEGQGRATGKVIHLK